MSNDWERFRNGGLVMYLGIDIIQFITAVAAVFGLFFSYQASRKSSYINTITVERIKWLNKLKELVAEFVSCCYNNNSDFVNFVRLHKIILLYLNPKEDEKIIRILSNMISLTVKAQEELKTSNDDKYFLDLTEHANELINHIQAKCKLEWERIKKETGDKKQTTEYKEITAGINNLAQEYREIYCRTDSSR